MLRNFGLFSCPFTRPTSLAPNRSPISPVRATGPNLQYKDKVYLTPTTYQDTEDLLEYRRFKIWKAFKPKWSPQGVLYKGIYPISTHCIRCIWGWLLRGPHSTGPPPFSLWEFVVFIIFRSDSSFKYPATVASVAHASHRDKSSKWRKVAERASTHK